jgi:hypothetical protein
VIPEFRASLVEKGLTDKTISNVLAVLRGGDPTRAEGGHVAG